jgi:hypothetical protein
MKSATPSAISRRAGHLPGSTLGRLIVTVGLDLHRRHITACALDEAGTVLAEAGRRASLPGQAHLTKTDAIDARKLAELARAGSVVGDNGSVEQRGRWRLLLTHHAAQRSTPGFPESS